MNTNQQTLAVIHELKSALDDVKHGLEHGYYTARDFADFTTLLYNAVCERESMVSAPRD